METSINFRDLQRTSTEEVNEIYSKVEETIKGLLSNAYGNKSQTYFSNLELKYKLTQFQLDILSAICWELSQITTAIDPQKLAGIDMVKDVMNEDGELILYRESVRGLISLTIYDEDLIAFALSGKNASDDVLTFFEAGQDIDFESITYKLLSK